MKSLFLILSFLFTTTIISAQNDTKFSKAEVLEDLAYLYASLQATHHNLYAYTSKEEFDEAYAEVASSIIQDSLTLLEATNTLQRLSSLARNGHTGVLYPIQSYSDYVYAGGTVFPLEIAFADGKPLVRKNWSSNTNITPGAELMSINGKPIAEVLARIYPQISAERRYFANVMLEVFTLPRYYWQVFGEEKNFEVELRSNNEIQQYQIEAVSALEGFEMKRTDVLNAQMKLTFFEQTAYLNPGDLSGDESVYQAFIDSAFMEIKQSEPSNLIIDLRNNGGGDNSFGDYLVSYIANQPFYWTSNFTLKSSDLLKADIRESRDTTTAFWQSALTHESGEVYEYAFEAYQPQAVEKRFTGKVYVLVNRQSHSQSAVTAAQIQDYGFGTIAGEETGDYPSLHASIFHYSLPNTGIPVKVSKGYIVRVNGSTKEEGVIPDIVIKDYLLDEEDEILEGLLDRLAQ